MLENRRAQKCKETQSCKVCTRLKPQSWLAEMATRDVYTKKIEKKTKMNEYE